MKKNSDSNFPSLEEYLAQCEPEKAERAANWATAIGLQKVDGLDISPYLIQVALNNIEGEIDIDTVKKLIANYYEENGETTPRSEEADKVSIQIAKLLGERAFTFSPEGLISIHRRLFLGVFSHAGQLRTVNLTKQEWVLNGDSVTYAPYTELKPTLEYEINIEKNFSYLGLNAIQILQHISKFVASIWQIHPFREGNTRTTAVFTIKYLRTLGFDVNNSLFENKAKYFRDALARANYSNLPNGITENYMGLDMFFSNFLFGTDYSLKERSLHVDTSSLNLEPTFLNASILQLSSQVTALVLALGEETLSAVELKEKVNLKDRKNFREIYLKPAIEAGLVTMSNPEKPNSNRQKYRLTVKGYSFSFYLQLISCLQSCRWSDISLFQATPVNNNTLKDGSWINCGEE